MPSPNFDSNTLFTGDNLDIMRGMNDECVDLIYLDPPFNSNVVYGNVLGKSKDLHAQFSDVWELLPSDLAWMEKEAKKKHVCLYEVLEAAKAAYNETMQAYLINMTVRLYEMERILKPTGSIYLHCDPTASHYLKIVMDCVFGHKNFRNEIVWCYAASPSTTTSDFPRKHDVVFRYAKSDNFTFNDNDVRVPYAESSKKRAEYKTNKSTVLAGEDIELNPNGKIPPSVWTDIQQAYRYRREYQRYPTQKPLALLERIIKASSDEGDLVLDPFCGCATTMVAAEKLGRKWVGIDLSSVAIYLVSKRMKEETDLFKRAKPNFEHNPPERTDGGVPTQDVFTDSGIDDCTSEIKKTLFMKQRGICNGCKGFKRARYLEIDHIIPKAKGGGDEKSNLQLLCITCHGVKGTGTMEEMMEKLREKKMIRPIQK